MGVLAHPETNYSGPECVVPFQKTEPHCSFKKHEHFQMDVQLGYMNAFQMDVHLGSIEDYQMDI